MLGQLPTSLDVRGRSFEIRSDYRNILCVFEAFSDPNLTDEDKVFVCLKRIYVRLDLIPHDWFTDAYKEAISFIECGQVGKSNTPAVMNWVKDEQLLFPAVNKVAGTEVRALPYLHWWTFLGYFQSVDREDLFSFVLSIRQKKARGKKLEKWEQDFYKNNRALCSLHSEDKNVAQETQKAAQSIFESLLAEGGET